MSTMLIPLLLALSLVLSAGVLAQTCSSSACSITTQPNACGALGYECLCVDDPDTLTGFGKCVQNLCSSITNCVEPSDCVSEIPCANVTCFDGQCLCSNCEQPTSSPSASASLPPASASLPPASASSSNSPTGSLYPIGTCNIGSTCDMENPFSCGLDCGCICGNSGFFVEGSAIGVCEPVVCAPSATPSSNPTQTPTGSLYPIGTCNIGSTCDMENPFSCGLDCGCICGNSGNFVVGSAIGVCEPGSCPPGSSATPSSFPLVSATPTVTRFPSATGSSSNSRTPSESASAFATPSSTPSGTITPSHTATGTRTSSRSVSGTRTASRSISSTRTPSKTPGLAPPADEDDDDDSLGAAAITGLVLGAASGAILLMLAVLLCCYAAQRRRRPVYRRF